MVLLVMALLVVAATLGFVFSTTSGAAAREEHRAAIGEAAQVLAENALEEAFFSIWNRVNSPRESLRARPDLYRSVRDLAPGQAISFEFKPLLAWRTALEPGAKIAPVKVTIRLDRIEVESRVTGVQTIQQALQGPPAGNARNACSGTTFRPVVTQRRIAVGEVTMSAKAQLDAGAGMIVTRQVEVGHTMRIGRVSERPPLAWVDVVPIRQFQSVDREAKL